MADLTAKTARGSAWMIAMRITVNLLGVSSMVILARLLTPEDFGLVALAGSVYVFLSLFGQFGFDIALIQHQSPDRSHYDTAWTSNILVGSLVAIGMIAVAKPAASLYQDPRIEHVVYAFALLSLAKGFENIGVINFRKNLAFRGDFLYFVVPKISSVIIGVVAAYLLRSYWALVIGMLSGQIATLLYSHFSQRFRPHFSLSRFAELFRFTKWILGGKILRFLTSNGVTIILGRLRNPESVGLFGIANEVAYLPSSEIAAPINRVLFPSFATIANDPERLRQAFAKVFAITVLVCTPAAFGILGIAESLVLVAFGEQWLPAAPILAVLALVGLLDAINTLVEPILMARGALRSLSLVFIGQAAVLVPAAVVLIYLYGAVGAAYAMLLGGCAATPMYYLAGKLEVGFLVRELLKSAWRPVLASVAMAAIVREAETLLVAGGTPSVTALLALVATGVVAYGVLMVLLWLVSGCPRFPEALLFDLIKSYLRQRLKREAQTQATPTPKLE
jgi:O-antigen/teichoic acid export membrane protein